MSNVCLVVGASVNERSRARSRTDRARISNPVSGGQCHLFHLTTLRRLSWPSLAYICFSKKPSLWWRYELDDTLFDHWWSEDKPHNTGKKHGKHDIISSIIWIPQLEMNPQSPMWHEFAVTTITGGSRHRWVDEWIWIDQGIYRDIFLGYMDEMNKCLDGTVLWTQDIAGKCLIVSIY